MLCRIPVVISQIHKIPIDDVKISVVIVMVPTNQVKLKNCNCDFRYHMPKCHQEFPQTRIQRQVFKNMYGIICVVCNKIIFINSEYFAYDTRTGRWQCGIIDDLRKMNRNVRFYSGSVIWINNNDLPSLPPEATRVKEHWLILKTGLLWPRKCTMGIQRIQSQTILCAINTFLLVMENSTKPFIGVISSFSFFFHKRKCKSMNSTKI